MILSEAEKLFKVTKETKSNLYSKPEFIEKLHEYREIFPNQKLPSGKAARTNIEDLKKRMSEFFIKYPYYDWDLVLDAATHYVETYRKNEFKFMKTAGYYIVKDGESDLATDCQLLLDGAEQPLIKNSHYTIT